MPTSTDRAAVIIVGSTGMIGGRLVERLCDDYRVFALDIKAPDEELPGNAQFMEMDVTSDEQVRRALDAVNEQHGGPIASIVQLAAYYDFSGEPSDLYEKITVEGTRRVLRKARELNVEQFIFSSSMLVHAPTTPGKPIEEESPLDAKWDYPQSKVAAEQVVEAERGEIPAVLLRIAGVYTDECNSLPLSHQIERIHERHVTGGVYPGDTRCGQAFVHLEDLADAVQRTIDRRSQLPSGVTPILIGEPETPSYDDLQRKFAELIHGEADWKTREIPKPVAKSGAWLQDKAPGMDDAFIKPWMIDMADDHYELDITRARKLLDWAPQHRLLDTLPAMVKCLQDDTQGWADRHGLELSGTAAGG